ncbi:MAG: hypothetical protein PHO32_07630 [Candidatus Cloacimonetes bacterium]|nr:hypothetical protein [Candidatus Cloacimonadota bacterium]
MIKLPEINSPVIRTEAGVTYTLANATIDYGIDNMDGELLVSVLNGDRMLYKKGDYFDGEIDMPVTYANYVAFKALTGEVVRLWMFGTGAVPDTSPQKFYPYCDVIITHVKPYYKNNKYYYDACTITFASEQYYSIAYAGDSGLPPET